MPSLRQHHEAKPRIPARGRDLDLRALQDGKGQETGLVGPRTHAGIRVGLLHDPERRLCGGKERPLLKDVLIWSGDVAGRSRLYKVSVSEVKFLAFGERL